LFGVRRGTPVLRCGAAGEEAISYCGLGKVGEWFYESWISYQASVGGCFSRGGGTGGDRGRRLTCVVIAGGFYD
jgi:hypothetical protein